MYSSLLPLKIGSKAEYTRGVLLKSYLFSYPPYWQHKEITIYIIIYFQRIFNTFFKFFNGFFTLFFIFATKNKKIKAISPTWKLIALLIIINCLIISQQSREYRSDICSFRDKAFHRRKRKRFHEERAYGVHGWQRDP